MCWATFSWTCVPTCLAAAPAKATDHWARILYPTASSGSVPPTIPRPLLLGIRMLREPKLLWTCCRLKGGVLLVERRVISLTDAPTHAHTSTRQLQLHLFLPVEPTMFLLLPSRTMPVGESIMLLWRKLKKLLMLSLVCFSSTTLL
jgi:hypothetical protein